MGGWHPYTCGNDPHPWVWVWVIGGCGCGLASETHGFTHADHYPDAGDPTSPFSHPLPKAQVSGRQGIITTHKVKITRFGSHSGCSLTLEAVAGKEPSA